MALKTKTPIGGLYQSLKTLFHMVFCFFVLYFILLLFLIPLILIIFTRYFLSKLFSVFYRRKFKLVDCFNGALACDNYASVFTLYFFVCINGPCDIEFLRQRIHNIFTTFRSKNGKRPYEIMLCSVREKFGFFCLENKRDSFDIKHHIRLFPGCSDLNRIYTEAEVFMATGELADDLWDEDKPRWEFLVVPQMKKEDTGEVCSVIHLRLHHIYTDGISSAQIIRLCIADKPAPQFIFDPVNPPGPRMPSWVKILTHIQAFFMGPWACLKFASNKEEHIFNEGPLTGGKRFGRTTLSIPVKEIRKIRKRFNCSTTVIQHWAMTSAMRKTAEKKGLPVPDDVLGSLIFAMIPYPHEYPQNHVTFGVECLPVGRWRDASLEDQLHQIHKIYENTTSISNYYALIASRWFLGLTGCLPVTLGRKLLGSVNCSYCLSNVPGISDIIYFNGNKVLNVYGTGCLVNGVRFFNGVTCYEDKFVFGFLTELGSLITNSDDLNDFIKQFENEMEYIMDMANQ